MISILPQPPSSLCIISFTLPSNPSAAHHLHSPAVPPTLKPISFISHLLNHVNPSGAPSSLPQPSPPRSRALIANLWHHPSSRHSIAYGHHHSVAITGYHHHSCSIVHSGDPATFTTPASVRHYHSAVLSITTSVHPSPASTRDTSRAAIAALCAAHHHLHPVVLPSSPSSGCAAIIILQPISLISTNPSASIIIFQRCVRSSVRCHKPTTRHHPIGHRSQHRRQHIRNHRSLNPAISRRAASLRRHLLGIARCNPPSSNLQTISTGITSSLPPSSSAVRAPSSATTAPSSANLHRCLRVTISPFQASNLHCCSGLQQRTMRAHLTELCHP